MTFFLKSTADGDIWCDDYPTSQKMPLEGSKPTETRRVSDTTLYRVILFFTFPSGGTDDRSVFSSTRWRYCLLGWLQGFKQPVQERVADSRCMLSKGWSVLATLRSPWATPLLLLLRRPPLFLLSLLTAMASPKTLVKVRQNCTESTGAGTVYSRCRVYGDGCPKAGGHSG